MSNIVLCVIQGLVAVLIALTGGVKIVMPRERLAERMHWAGSWPRWRIKLLGLAEVLGAVGLVVPAATGIAPVLTPAAAVFLAVLMGGAIQTHRRLREGFAPAAVIGVLCLAIAAVRFASVTA
jgi:hypothetical protein